MNRRTFLAGSLGGSIIGRPAHARPAVFNRTGGAVKMPAGLSLAALRDKWRHELFDDVLR